MGHMEYTYYGFRHCIGAFFEMATMDARKLLPAHLEPLEIQHESSILAITAFSFVESAVGAYDEIVLAIIVPPMIIPGQALPNAGFYPFAVATSTEAARLHAINRWHLPHYMQNIQVKFTPEEGQMTANVSDGAAPVLDLVVTEYEFKPASNLYNAFTVAGDEHFKANIHMEAPHSEHEEERGSLTLYEHPITSGLTLDQLNTSPFREQWYKEGVQTFEPLETI